MHANLEWQIGTVIKINPATQHIKTGELKTTKTVHSLIRWCIAKAIATATAVSVMQKYE